MGGLERTYDKPRLDKLGVKPGSRVAILDVDDDALREELSQRTDDVTQGPPGPGTDLVFLGADSVHDLGRLQDVRAHLRPDGAIWVISRKGRGGVSRSRNAPGAGLAPSRPMPFR